MDCTIGIVPVMALLTGRKICYLHPAYRQYCVSTLGCFKSVKEIKSQSEPSLVFCCTTSSCRLYGKQRQKHVNVRAYFAADKTINLNEINNVTILMQTIKNMTLTDSEIVLILRKFVIFLNNKVANAAGSITIPEHTIKADLELFLSTVSCDILQAEPVIILSVMECLIQLESENTSVMYDLMQQVWTFKVDLLYVNI